MIAHANRLARGWPSLLAGAIALALTVAMAFDNGGYFPPSYLGAGVVAFATLGVVLVARPPHYTFSTHALVGLAGLAGLTAWTVLSAGWSPAPSAALEAAERDLVYLGLFGLGLVAAGSGRYASLQVWGVLGAIVVVCGAGLLSRLYPDLVGGGATPLQVYRLAYPISYWNAYGALCGMGIVLGVGLASDPRAPFGLRGACVGAAFLLSVGMYFSLSRGAWLATFAALALLLAAGPRRVALLFNSALVASPAAVAIVRLRHYPSLVLDPRAGGGQLRQGHAFSLELIVLVVAGVVVGTIAAVAHEPLVRLGRTLKQGRAVEVSLIVLCVGVALAGLVVESGRIGSFVDRQWSDFLKPVSGGLPGAARLGDLRGSRSDVYRVALDGFAANPIRGSGAGSFASEWFRARRVEQQLVNAHSLELETLDELGLIGGTFLAVVFGAIVAAAARARSRTGALSPQQAAAVTGAFLVWVVHSAVDWDWQIGALTGLALVLVATLFPAGRARVRGRVGRAPS